MKDRATILRENPLEPYLESRGVKLIGTGDEKSARCPFHEDKTASLSVNGSKGVWICHAGCGGGSIIDLIARFEGKQPQAVLAELGQEPVSPHQPKAKSLAPAKPEAPAGSLPNFIKPKLVKTYDYQDALGRVVFQVCRLEPKSFRQRRPVAGGKWIWNMDGVVRVLYHLPQVLKLRCKPVFVCEGEKDADTLWQLGHPSTTNVGGAGKWMDAYSDVLAGRDVVLCGDNDQPGMEHVDQVLNSLQGKAKTVRVIRVPAPHKDVTDWLDYLGPDLERRFNAVSRLLEDAVMFERGINLPVQTMAEIEQDFRRSINYAATRSLNLGSWLPTLGRCVRPLVGGEILTILGGTGVGKTALAQNLALHARPLKTLLFEQELPSSLTFERFVAIATRTPQIEVYRSYKTLDPVDWRKTGSLDHIYTCSLSGMTPARIAELISKSELKIGEPPALVIVDYIQLMSGRGERYERVSDAAEQLKGVAKATNTIIVIISQIARKHDDYAEVRLSDGKESGSIENSSGVLIGAWRTATDDSLLMMRVLKNTKGFPGAKIKCNFDGERLLITERAEEQEHVNERKPYAD